jgi:hypothetical protein
MTPAELEEVRAKSAYWGATDMAMDHDHCFLCGATLSDGTRTDEHVFPRWLLGDFELWNDSLRLRNGTLIRYRSFTIPCCTTCNTYWLSNVENVVSGAFRSGTEAVQDLDETLLCLWLTKIYYGIHFKEIGLAVDRTDPDAGAIRDGTELAQLSEVHHLLQALRQKVIFRLVPGSVYVFATQVPDELAQRFDYWDSMLNPVAAIRCGSTGVVAAIGEWGILKAAGTPGLVNAAAQVSSLHPVQFKEVYALVAYAASLLDVRFAYLVGGSGDIDVIEPVVIAEDGQGPGEASFGDFEMADFAIILSELTGIPSERLYDAKTQMAVTTLSDDAGRPREVSIENFPAGAELIPEWPEDRPT